MDSINLPFARNAAFTWGLWKVLDQLLLRYFPEWWPQLRRSPNGHAGSFASGTPDVAAIMRSSEFASACRELGDPGSPVLCALAALWAAGGGDAPGDDLDFALSGLSLEQGLVVLAVLAQAASAGEGAGR